MELSIYAAPAFLALIAKAVIFLYARKTGTRNFLTRLFVWFLLVLSVQNVAEIFLFASHAKNLATPFGGTLYFSIVILALAMLLHIVLILVLDWPQSRLHQKITWWLYAPVIPLEILLWFTPWLVAGFQMTDIGYREITGPVYFIFEIYVFTISLGVLALLAYGNRPSEIPWRKLKNRLMLLGLLPPLVVVLSVMTLQHFGIYVFNATITLPIAVTFFLIVTAYAIHRHRLFDIQFYIPGSKVRRRKTAFYNRIKSMIAEIADLNSINDVINRLAETLSCPVVLVTGNKPVIAAVGNAQFMAGMPQKTLSEIDHIVVANEINSENPERFKMMKKFHIAAIVPFYPYSQHASGWILLGESFSNQVYTSRDFRLTEQLFEKMADLFLDKLLNLRHQLEHSTKELKNARLQESITKTRLDQAVEEISNLRTINNRLSGTQLADSTNNIDASDVSAMFEGTVTLLSRNKLFLKNIREDYPQCACYTGPDSASFKKQNPADVYICELNSMALEKNPGKFLKLINKFKNESAFLFFGEQAEQWIQNYRQQLTGCIIDTLASTAGMQLVSRKIQALRLLRANLVSEHATDYPYAASQIQSQEVLKRAQYLIANSESILIKGNDVHEAESLATLALKSNNISTEDNLIRSIKLVDLVSMWSAANLENYLDSLVGSSLLINLEDSYQTSDVFFSELNKQVTNRNKEVNFIFIAINKCDENILKQLPAQTIDITPLYNRKQDQQILAHYYILQFNIQSVSKNYLSQNDVNEVLSALEIITVDSLRSAILNKLGTNTGPETFSEKLFDNGNLPKRTLDEYVSGYEKQIINQTLQHCGGNKSQTARLLGLRPNTLHYKLERYGLLEK